MDFELVGASSGIAKLPKPKEMDELENSTDDDAFFEDHVVHHEDDEESDKGEKKSATLYTEYVALRGSSFHEDCQVTL